MLKFCNMKITLKRVEDCVGFFEKTQISLAEQKKAMMTERGVKELLISSLQFVLYLCDEAFLSLIFKKI